MATKNHAIGSRRLLYNVTWNFLGQALPLVVALFAIPVLVHRLGVSRFGVLTLAWMFIGYFSLFDLGLGRALTKLVSERLGAGKVSEVPDAVRTTLVLMFAFGLAGMALAAACSPWLVDHTLKVPEELRQETLGTFYLLAASIPIVILASGFRGVLEAHQRFGAINIIRAVQGIFSFLGPVLVLPFSNSLVAIVAVLVVMRLIAFALHFWLCRQVLPVGAVPARYDRELARWLLRWGGWMTVSNVIGPLMVYLDRFLIGAVVSLSAVAYYVTPYEVVTKLWIIPGAIAGVLFPIFAAGLVGARAETLRLYTGGVKALFLAMFPICLLIVTFAADGLTLWLGREFAQNSTAVLQWLTVGVLLNSMAQVPFALIQSAGRADLTARLHLFELPAYMIVLWWVLHHHGIVGAAMVWTARVAVDTVLLFLIARRILAMRQSKAKLHSLIGAGAGLLLLGGSMILDLMLRIGFVLAACALSSWVGWRFVLDAEERGYALRTLKSGFRRVGWGRP